MSERFSLTIESVGDHAIPAATRLRSLLKLMLRGFGLRCVEAKEVATEIPAATEVNDD
ncbi:MAG: hypothetical protein U0941_29825 [Planctomycetaceae bacterium]